MELAQRTASALSLANDAAKADLAQRMVDGADAWVDALAADEDRAPPVHVTRSVGLSPL